MLSCKKSSELIEKKFFSKLTVIEKIQLMIHTRMCDACKSWEKQSENMDYSLKHHFHSKKNNTTETILSQDIKQSIIKKIENQE